MTVFLHWCSWKCFWVWLGNNYICTLLHTCHSPSHSLFLSHRKAKLCAALSVGCVPFLTTYMFLSVVLSALLWLCMLLTHLYLEWEESCVSTSVCVSLGEFLFAHNQCVANELKQSHCFHCCHLSLVIRVQCERTYCIRLRVSVKSTEHLLYGSVQWSYLVCIN